MSQEFEDGIDMSDAEHVAWVKAQHDPDLWHLAAQAALAYRGDQHEFLQWLVQQPDMDRATAGWIFLWAEGSLYLKGETNFYLNVMSSQDMVALFKAICTRSESIGFLRDELGIDADFEAERLKCVEVVASGKTAAEILVPHKIIDRPFAKPQSSRYQLDDGIIFV